MVQSETLNPTLKSVTNNEPRMTRPRTEIVVVSKRVSLGDSFS